MEKEPNSVEVRVGIAWSTILKLLLGVLLAFVAIRLWPVFKLLVMSMLLAVALYRLVLWACHRGWPRWAGLLLASLVLVLSVLGFGAVIGPTAFNQASQLSQNLPKINEEISAHLPKSGPLRAAWEDGLKHAGGSDLQRFSKQALAAAKTTLEGLLDLVLVVAMTIYLMADGPRAVRWIVAFFPAEHRHRVTQGLEEVARRVVAYVVGQAIVSGLFAGYVFLILSLLRVPLALALGLLAGLLDIIPVVGISISLLLGVFMGWTVSPMTALLVLMFYSAYHVVENYVIAPKVFGRQLRLSSLAVLLSLIAGGTLAGVVGVVAILPLVAAYPALESLWRTPLSQAETVEDHQAERRAA